MKKYLYLMRVHHYIKNILIFMPLIFSGNLTDRRKFTATLLGMIAFSLVTSAVYIINDIRDAEKDRMHPTKKNRPIASGAVTPFHAVVLMVFILIAAVVLLVVSDATAGSYALVILYLFINVAYSMGLKDVPLLDVTILASGFLLRVLFGAVLTGTEVSEWLYLTVLSGAFYFSLGKRRNELQKKKDGDTRKVLKYYTRDFLDKNMYMCLALLNTFYALWCKDITNAGMEYAMWTVPIVILICMKYSLTVEGNSEGDPVEVLLHDRVLMALCVVYGIVMRGMLYFGAECENNAGMEIL